MATSAEYAKLSEAVYNETGAPSGWTRLLNSDPNNTGYQGAAFQENGTNVIVVANRGTEPTQLTDLRADLQMGLNQLPGQYQYAKDFLDKISATYPDANISITGHSLGGALSQLLGAETGLYTETFNPYGAKDLADKLGIDPNGAFPNIHNNQTRFDPVSRLPGSEHLGDMTTYTAPSELPAMLTGLPFGLPGVTAASLRSHLLDLFTEEIFPPSGTGTGTGIGTDTGTGTGRAQERAREREWEREQVQVQVQAAVLAAVLAALAALAAAVAQPVVLGAAAVVQAQAEQRFHVVTHWF